MRAYILIIALGSIVGLSLLSGCRTNPRTQRQTALLRAEILDLEDQYYAMKSRYESTVRQLRECRGEPIDAPIDGLTGSEMILNGPIEECLDCEPGFVTPDPGAIYLDEAPFEQPQSLDTFREAEPPTSFDSGPDALPPSRSLEQLPPAEGEDPQSGLDDSFELDWADEPAELKSSVSDIVIHPKHTYASNVDGRRGDDGLVLLVQPKASDARTMMIPGELIVEIVDPTGDRDRRRIGRWEFTRSELQLFANEINQGYELHLPWDRNIPRSSRLRVLVRFTTDDGRKLDSSSEFRLTPPGGDYSPNDPLIAEWTMRAGGQPRQQTSRVRRGVNAIPASSGTPIQRPRWRPVR